MAEDLEFRVEGLELLAPAEQRQLFLEWNSTERDYPKDRCLHELIEDQATRTPDAVAVTFEGTQLTYVELDRRANQLAHFLQGLGVGPEVLVGICVERSLAMIVALLGILKAGGAYVPLDPSYPSERLAWMAEDARVKVLLTEDRLLPRVPADAAVRVCLDRDWARIGQEREDRPVGGSRPEQLAYVIFTSGSTGRPKGAMNTHQGICNRLLWMQEAYRLGAVDRVLQKTPLSFDVSVWELFWPLITGARLVVARPSGHQDPDYLVQLIQDQALTTMHCVPSMLGALVEAEGLEACTSLRQMICSGEALSVELSERFFRRCAFAALHNLYGPTEASVDVTAWTCERGTPPRSIPIGRPIANCRIHLLDRELRPVPIGAVGELYIAGTGLGRGYLHQPGLTAEKFVPDPFSIQPGARLYKSGDLARYRNDGAIEYLGRVDHQVKIRGFRIELGEIEAVLLRHPAVRETVIVAREDTPGEKRLVAYLASSGEQAPSTSELRAHLQKQLPEYMVPSAFVTLEALPLSPSGKIDRRALPVPGDARPRLSHEWVSPRDAFELELVRLWEGLFGIHPIGVTDDFFELGGNSLLALRLMAQIEMRQARALPLSALFHRPTIEQFAALLRQGGLPEPWSPLVTLHRGTRPPLFLVHPIGGNVFCYVELAHLLGEDQQVYGIQAQGLDGQQEPLGSVAQMAAFYVGVIRGVQPQGPYFLAGWSFGGAVVYEMAQLLRSQGQKVALLGLIEARPTHAATRGRMREASRDFDPEVLSFWFTVIMGRTLGTEIEGTLEEFSGLGPDARIELILRKLRPLGYVIEEGGLTQLRIAFRLFSTHMRALSGCVPEAYPDRLTLLRARDQVIPRPHRPLPPPWAWEELAPKIENHEIPGTHFEVLRPHNVAALAACLRGCLERAQKESAGV